MNGGPDARAPGPPRRGVARATITVLAGVNGSGKSSIAGELILDEGAPYYNPDVEAREILAQGLAADQREANSLAWKLGVMGLSRAIDTGGSFTLETTLASSTIRSELERAAYLGTHRLVIWYVGLATVADNIRRVRERHVRGGHDIPVEDIKRRFEISPRNLMRLMEVVTDCMSSTTQPKPPSISLAVPMRPRVRSSVSSIAGSNVRCR